MQSRNYFARGWKKSYYRSGRRAVSSHSLRGQISYGAISSYVPNEMNLSAEERKSSILPCGFTIAESWAALRKSWLGFEIAKSNNNSALMSMYAGIIRKVQREMGIQQTIFDMEILEDQALGDEGADTDGSFCRNNLPNDVEVNTTSIDYDAILGEARTELLDAQGEIKVEPRAEIFSGYEPSENSWQDTRSKVQEEGKDVEEIEEEEDGGPEVDTWIRHRNACEYDRSTGQVEEVEEEGEEIVLSDEPDDEVK
jgi:hypothetical protein